MNMVYLDNNATTAVLPAIVQAMTPYFTTAFGNPSAIHQRGVAARAALDKARQAVAGLLGCQAAEIVFTSGGTEGDNLAVFGVVKPGSHIITSAIEHHAVLNSCRRLEQIGCSVTRLPVDGRGVVDPDAVRHALRPATALISIMMANNETGTVQPVEDIGRIAAEADVWFHTDAVQAAGKLAIDVNRIGCDLLTISGHKFHAPQGVGALFVRRGTPLHPLMHGGPQEQGRRAGTENVPGIVGLGKAAEIAADGLQDGSVARIAAWRDRLEAAIHDAIADVAINGASTSRVPNTTNIFFDYVPGEALLLALDKEGIAVSAGAACSAGSGASSHVLTAMGLGEMRARCSLRFSLGKQNREEDVDAVLAVLPGLVQRLRDASPLYRRAMALSPVPAP
ncbi:MAG: cysteine desulfurase family protein [Azospirillaceae bacterium]|nr:cysteine desulfurase family protein [Azospirillaceae bacterium]